MVRATAVTEADADAVAAVSAVVEVARVVLEPAAAVAAVVDMVVARKMTGWPGSWCFAGRVTRTK